MKKSSIRDLYNTVNFLTGLSPARSYINPGVLNRVAAYLFEKLESYGCRVSYQEFEVEGQTYRNVTGSIGPEDGTRIIIGAHYDVAGNHPGADDNASAVAGLLESARILTGQADQLKKRIEFVAYSLEEPPFLGRSLWAVLYMPRAFMIQALRWTA